MSGKWAVRKSVRLLRPGERFVFAEELGGEGEVLTVRWVSADMFGSTEIGTEELDFDLDVTSKTWVTMAPGEDEDD